MKSKRNGNGQQLYERVFYDTHVKDVSWKHPQKWNEVKDRQHTKALHNWVGPERISTQDSGLLHQYRNEQVLCYD